MECKAISIKYLVMNCWLCRGCKGQCGSVSSSPMLPTLGAPSSEVQPVGTSLDLSSPPTRLPRSEAPSMTHMQRCVSALTPALAIACMHKCLGGIAFQLPGGKCRITITVLSLHDFPAKRQGMSCRQAAVEGIHNPTPCRTHLPSKTHQPWAQCSVFIPGPASQGHITDCILVSHANARADSAKDHPVFGQQRHSDKLPETGPVSWTRGELLGAGAFGRVYLGLNNDTGQLMAVKQVSCCFAWLC